MLTREELKKWIVYHKRRKEVGVNGLTQESFLVKLCEFLEEKTFQFCYKQTTETMVIGTKIHIADIRQNPNVKRDFRKNDLMKFAKDHQFTYKHYSELGNPFYKRHLREQDPSKAKKEYQTVILKNDNAQKDFQDLLREFRYKQLIVIICYCKTAPCHRFWLIELLDKMKRIEISKEQKLDELFPMKEEIIITEEVDK